MINGKIFRFLVSHSRPRPFSETGCIDCQLTGIRQT